MSLDERTERSTVEARLEAAVLEYLKQQGAVSFARIREELIGYRPGILQLELERLHQIGKVRKVSDDAKRDNRCFARASMLQYLGKRVGIQVERVRSAITEWYLDYSSEDS